MKSIILTGGRVFNYVVDIKDVEFYDIYNRSIPLQVLKILRHSSATVVLSLDNWKLHIQEYDVIIIFDSEATYSVLKWISKHATSNTRKILCYRNSIISLRKEVTPVIVEKLGFEFWSYNRSDCEKYGLKYNPQMLRRDLFTTIPSEDSAIYDILFLGNSKGRGDYLSQLKKVFTNAGLKCYFYIPDMPELDGNMCRDGAAIPYKNYIELIGQSKAILDIVNEKNYGLTFRPVEALFAKRKLITNYQEIVKYDFYCRENVYVLDNAVNMDDFRLFLTTPYKEIDKDIISNYDISRWYEHFFEE